MKIPAFIKLPCTIGVVAPSFGVSGERYIANYEKAKQELIKEGFTIVECKSTYQLEKAQSNTPKNRAKELMKFYLDDKIDIVWSCAGGEIMNEILPYLDFKLLKQAKPKWFIGYSDNTNFCLPLATHAHIASIYDMTMTEYKTDQWIESSNDLIMLLKNDKTVFKQYLDEDTGVLPRRNIKLEGYLIGGTLDVITNLMGTEYEIIKEFSKRKKGKVLLYLEAYDYNVLGVKRCLWQMSQAGYFNHIQGIVLGKLRIPEPLFDVTLDEALKDLKLNIPIIYDVEVGHTYPTIPFVNGAYAKVEVKNKRFTITYDFKHK